MFDAWKSRLDQREDEDEHVRGNEVRNPERRLADRRVSLLGSGLEENPKIDEATVHEIGASNETFSDAGRFVAEQRASAETLLGMIRSLEERLKDKALAVQAARAYAAARDRVKAAETLERQAELQLEALAERRFTLVGVREDAEELVGELRSDAERLKGHIAQVESRLQDAYRLAQDLSVQLEEREMLAKQCAEAESAAAAELARAQRRVEGHRAAHGAAAAEAQSAKERAAATRASGEDPGDFAAARSSIEDLALGIAGAAGTFAPAGRGSARPPARDAFHPIRSSTSGPNGTPAERARSAYPNHPNRRSAFIAGWNQCAKQGTTNEAIVQILAQYMKRVHNFDQFVPSASAMRSMRDALEAALLIGDDDRLAGT